MNDMISKELLNEVLEYKYFICGSYNDRNEYRTCSKCTDIGKIESPIINIYELAHKCKEWAKNNGFYIINYPTKTEYVSKLKGEFTESWTSDTEPEAIFKTCQWILENKG